MNFKQYGKRNEKYHTFESWDEETKTFVQKRKLRSKFIGQSDKPVLIKK